MRNRDTKAEYARRIARGLARGLTKAQARGHAKATEAFVRAAKPIPDERLQLALRELRQGRPFAAAARAANVSRERLRKHLVENNVIRKKGRRWRVRDDLPRRVQLLSNGETRVIVVGEFAAASLVGRYMNAVGRFLNDNKVAPLAPFVGLTVRDIKGHEHPFETRPNVLYRLAVGGESTFEHIYRLVI
jgi:hypothetical protein